MAYMKHTEEAFRLAFSELIIYKIVNIPLRRSRLTLNNIFLETIKGKTRFHFPLEYMALEIMLMSESI